MRFLVADLCLSSIGGRPTYKKKGGIVKWEQRFNVNYFSAYVSIERRFFRVKKAWIVLIDYYKIPSCTHLPILERFPEQIVHSRLKTHLYDNFNFYKILGCCQRTPTTIRENFRR